MSRIPPDYERCQCTYLEGSFMTLGPRSRVRCDKPPTVIVFEIHPDPEDDERGSMSLCDAHLAIFKKQQPDWKNKYTFVNVATNIKESAL